jgi:hypothetical protein
MENIFEGLKDFKFELDESSIIEQKDLYIMDALKRNSTFVECDRCHTIGNEPNMLRWHFDRCTTKFRNCEHCKKIIPRQNVIWKVKKVNLQSL